MRNLNKLSQKIVNRNVNTNLVKSFEFVSKLNLGPYCSRAENKLFSGYGYGMGYTVWE